MSVPHEGTKTLGRRCAECMVKSSRELGCVAKVASDGDQNMSLITEEACLLAGDWDRDQNHENSVIRDRQLEVALARKHCVWDLRCIS